MSEEARKLAETFTATVSRTTEGENTMLDKQKWIDDLRSGKFPKGEDHLSKDGSYCCLGVLLATQGGTRSNGAFDPDLVDGEELSSYGRRRYGITGFQHRTLTAVNDRHRDWEPVINEIEDMTFGEDINGQD